MAKLKEGSKAPDFTLQDQDGKAHTLSSYEGEWVLLYFYPKDNTPGCTKEACTIRDSYESFRRSKFIVLGVSTDSVKSHQKFKEKYSLPFTLLADVDKSVVRAYGVWNRKKFLGRKYMGTDRMSFLIDPDGMIAKVYGKVRPAAHAAEVLADKKKLS